MVAPASTGAISTGVQPPANRQPTRSSSTHPSHSHNVPLSARRSAPLDLSTVERRGQPNAPREPSKRIRPHGLQEAPTFRPTEEEFKDPLEYIRKIAPEGKKYGICRIIPPENWQPPFAIDTERFHFKTRRQELNSVEGGTRANLNYLDQLAKFHKQHGTNLNRFPSVDKRPLDLYKLKKAVEIRGGFDQVCKMKKWAEIGRDLGYSGKIMSSLSTSLKNSYQRWLQPYEEYLRVVKPGVQQQLELEHGGPYTPSPNQSPMAKKPVLYDHITPSTTPQAPPSIPVAGGPHGTPKEIEATPDKPTPPVESAAPRPVTSGFTPVNAGGGGFTAVNRSPSFVAVNSGPVVKKEAETGSLTPQSVAEHPQSSTPVPNGNGSHPMKRAISHESGSQTEGGETDASGRRSKRLRKDAPPPTVAGSHMSLLRPAPPRARKSDSRKIGDKCEVCGKSEDRPSILVCDSCDQGYHRNCLDPPLTNIPEYDWHCPKCLVGTGEFGFEEGGVYSLKQFQEKANSFKKNYFASKMPFDPVLNTHRRESEDDVEREFWRLVESLTETVEVEYGADIHSTTHGSGFPTIERNPLDPYSTDPWNLNVLPFHGDSLFRHIKSDISGMTVPWVYVGMCFSTFCWHNEDHYAYSANYQHFGATKTWYGIPGSDAEAFEEAMRQAVPELFEGQPDLLFQLVTLMPPDQLKKAGVNVYALDQRAGQFVITFPQAYHAGFNHGFNFNEAVNFAPADWEPWGAMGVERLQAFRRHPCFSHDELLLTAAARDTSITTAKWLAPALQRTCHREVAERAAFIHRHREIAPHNCALGSSDSSASGGCQLKFVMEEEDLPEDAYQCQYCKAYTYLTQFRCHKSGKTVCLLHAETFDCCGDSPSQRLLGPDHTLRYRMSDDTLKAVVQKVQERARIPEAWGEKLDKVLEDEPKPQLKVLHSLLSEGEKIPYHLHGLQDLAAFVQRCDKWVEEATNYITRKQQNRRKNEKAWRKSTSKAAQLEERDREVRRIENMYALLAEADKLSFDCPQMAALEEKTREIEKFRQDVNVALMNPHIRSIQEVEELVESARNFNVEIPEVEGLEHILRQMRWNDEARRKRDQYMTLKECQELVQAGEQLGLSETNEHLSHFKELCRHGETWEAKAKELMSVESVHYQQLEALSAQALRFPVSPETLSAVDAILTKQREAQKKIQSLYERSKNPDFRKRPKYKEVRELMDSLEALNNRPTGAIDLEREQKRHEDWMRKGKKLFGKANAPLHILKSHMEYVEKRNSYCFDLEDRCRPPVEPSSRDNTPDGLLENHTTTTTTSSMWGGGKSRKRDVFCICRHSEAGMMIECEVCHEWYHGKCLKIARGKVKEFDKYTCPICDWRQKIPRDAARPKLEDLQDWQAEIPGLPFQPDEEQVLENIINQATTFRDFIQSFTNAACTTTEEVPTLVFYLRKIEGAEVLLAYETNFFRQEIHKWAPVAPEPPPILEQSLSTRKPRPTKQQKIMAQLGVERPEDLPPHLRTKQPNHAKRKSLESQTPRPAILQPTPHTPGEDFNRTGPALTPMTDAQNPPYPFSANYSLPASDSTPAFAPGASAFLPHVSAHSPSFPPRSPSPHHGLDSALFSSPRFNRDPTEGPPVVDVDNQDPFNSSPRHNLDDVFADLTNQDAEPEPEPEPMENTHANEALEALDASNGGDHSDAMQDDDSPDTGVDGDMNGQADAEDTTESS
ncbi:putative PHD transcription factor (Rum1) [Aspergillus fischeri NRRL 181]|uniref:PHD transcription factor (Rum1), putative n=1 Tax=Neosartorya fischeri (strain ATCC 1020 / DSM 3700 / CBS 544.65 / FGSC A1164 / JCM 1740 / NRRL 181 / WB 181) TaxID=331117 RepID=A1CZX4_NEOFI|nr:PHD transcription factor (Rum1), putative [Aspergillus fischeri NRRL 181]EAW24294.1 PHD transcription factor (Rum1), putative [Aspergillus fischeri NRRL 181]